jgi:hypothetical protein
MNLKINRLAIEKIIFNILKNRVEFLISLGVILAIIIAIITFNFFSTKKKAMQSAYLAIGFSLLGEKKHEEALYHFQKVFNETENTYKVIAGAGVIQSLSNTENGGGEKSLKVLEILKNYNKNPFFSLILHSAYFSSISLKENKESIIGSPFFEKFEGMIIKSQDPLFLEQLANIYLNLGEKQKFRVLISGIKHNQPFAKEGEFPTILERAKLLNSLK